VRGVRKAKGKTKGARGSRGRPDPWGPAVYGFEDDWPEANRDTSTIGECRALVALACAAFGLKAPPVKFDKRAKESYCYEDGSGIYLIPTQRNKFVALHEAAHYIVDRYFGRFTEDHGFEFQGVYFFLLENADVAPARALSVAATARGLLWRTTSPKYLQNACQRY